MTTTTGPTTRLTTEQTTVYEGLPPSSGNYRSPRRCGTSAIPVVTTNGFIYIHVYTDSSVQSGGMLGRLVFSKMCGKTYSKNGQEISSPFYPDSLPEGITEYVCEFRITAPTGSTVRIEFSFLHMEAHDECIYDRIEFYNEADINGEPLQIVCGETVPTNPVYLNTDSVVVKVISDYAYTSYGFVFTYWFE
ncbi:Cubilin-like [Holothuria leucospilota]|uniref:Cubilin-like n=1 Tax=Holothuria leucospilota TaxID=206669 RepID=A0A9Q0YPM6_HOLLE|nr:Cubilin-like [Holothuria leucospilota]